MRVKVIKTYKDKYTNLLHLKNTETEVTKKRFEEINSTSFGVFLEEIVEEKADNKKKSAKK